MWIPYGLPIIVGMDINKPRGDDFPPGIDFFLAGAGDLADFGDLAIRQRDVCFVGGAAGTVDDGAAADDEVWLAHGVLPGPLCFLGSSLGREAVRRQNAKTRQEGCFWRVSVSQLGSISSRAGREPSCRARRRWVRRCDR